MARQLADSAYVPPAAQPGADGAVGLGPGDRGLFLIFASVGYSFDGIGWAPQRGTIGPMIETWKEAADA